MATPTKIGPSIHLAAADSPFNDLLEMFQLRLIVLTPAAADATLTLFASSTASGTQIVGIYLAKSSTSSLAIPFPVDKETPRWATALSATLSGAGATADLYFA